MGTLDELTDEELEFLIDNPDVYIETVRTIKGEEFSLEERPYLREIYHQFKPNTPNTVVWKSARKCEKTETVGNILLEKLTTMSYFTATYTIARSIQVNVFSTERLTTMINTSVDGVFEERLLKPTSVSHKQFVDDPEGLHPNHLYMYSAWGEAVSLLGQANDMVVVDEVQDMPGVWFPKVREIIKLSLHKWMFLTGTARDQGDEFDKLWLKSDMREWYVTCDKCGRKQVLNFDNIMGKEGSKYKGCIECKTEIDPKNGVWQSTHPNPKKALFVGFHTSQIMHPQITADEIWLSYISYDSDRAFFNEVFGESYAGGSRPVTNEMVLSCTKTNLRYKYTDDGDDNVGGMDCGKGHHITIMDKNKNILWQEVIDTRRYITSGEIIEHVAKIIVRYRVKIFVIDFGYGQNEIKDLQAKFGNRVRGCRFGSVSIDKWIDYKKKDDDGYDIWRYNVNRSRAMEMIFKWFSDTKLGIPYMLNAKKRINSRDLAESTFQHYTNITSDLSKREQNDYYKIKKRDVATGYGRSGPDHFFMTLVYCGIARKKQNESKVQLITIV